MVTLKTQQNLMKFYNFFTTLLLILFISSPLLDAQNNNVLLIINYNHPHYESIPLLKKIYESHFKNIIFYGPTQHPQVVELPHFYGYFSYLCIADAMEKFKGYDGYLFLMDDCILNPFLINGLDTSKIAYAFCKGQHQSFPIDLKSGPPFYWSWWSSKWGIQAVNAALKNMPKKYKQILEKNCGERKVIGAFSDFVYIPSSYKNDFIELANLFGKYKVFLEIALPTIMCSLSSKNGWVWLPGQNTYANPLQQFDKNAIFNHPIKLSMREHREFIEDFFNQLNVR